MTFLRYTAYFVLALLIHEVCHSIAAYACRISISEFGVGWGPKIYSRRVRNIDFIFRLLPLGAYVRFDVAELQKRQLRQQVLVLMAGIIGNLISASLSAGTPFSVINYLLAATNILPLYQQDGWKCGIVMLRGILGRKSLTVEWTFTIAGSILSFAVLAAAVLRRFQ
jgi:membrane-associated protease RseP (regulator of RpoE activity)